MIGKVTLKNGSEIVLFDSGGIQSNNNALQKLAAAKLMYYRSKHSSAVGNLGVRFLHHIAEELGGRVEIEEKPAGPPGTVY